MTATLSKRILFGIVLFSTVIALWSKGAFVFNFSGAQTAVYTPSHVKPVVKTNTKTPIFIGRPIYSSQYLQLMDGYIKPIGGNGSLQNLRDFEDQNCNYTAATTNINKAYMDAITHINGQGPGVLAWKTDCLENPEYANVKDIPGGDMHNECLIFIHYMSKGWNAVKVYPGMSSDQILKLVK